MSKPHSGELHEEHDHDDDDHPTGSKIVKPKLKFKDDKTLFIKTKFYGILRFIWNNQKKQFIGKDGEDWAKLGAFYVVFYLAIGAFTWAMMLIFWGINSANYSIIPKYPGLSGVISDSQFYPGMGVRPHIGSGKADISFSTDSYSVNTLYLDELLKPYHDVYNNTVVCNGTQHEAYMNQSCRYEIFKYLKMVNCSPEEHYGYPEGEPCVFVKVNNLFGWLPGKVVKPSNNSYIPNQCNSSSTLYDGLVDPYVFVTCRGKSPADEKNINSITYASPFGINSCVAGIPFYFYPYRNVVNYMQPLVVLKLDLKRNTKVALTCLTWAKNMKQDDANGYGTISFTVTVNDASDQSSDSVF